MSICNSCCSFHCSELVLWNKIIWSQEVTFGACVAPKKLFQHHNSLRGNDVDFTHICMSGVHLLLQVCPKHVYLRLLVFTTGLIYSICNPYWGSWNLRFPKAFVFLFTRYILFPIINKWRLKKKYQLLRIKNAWTDIAADEFRGIVWNSASQPFLHVHTSA